MASNDFSSSQRNIIWVKYFGQVSSTVDVFGRTVVRGEFECDHVYPKSLGGKTVIENGMPLAPLSNAEKADNLHGVINGKEFWVKGSPSRGILHVDYVIKTL